MGRGDKEEAEGTRREPERSKGNRNQGGPEQREQRAGSEGKWD